MRDEKRLVSPGDANSSTQDRPADVQRRRHDGLAQGATDALIRHRFVSVDAVGIHAEQHVRKAALDRARPCSPRLPRRYPTSWCCVTLGGVYDHYRAKAIMGPEASH